MFVSFSLCTSGSANLIRDVFFSRARRILFFFLYFVVVVRLLVSLLLFLPVALARVKDGEPQAHLRIRPERPQFRSLCCIAALDMR